VGNAIQTRKPHTAPVTFDMKQALTPQRQTSSQSRKACVSSKLSHNCFSFKHIAVLTPDAYDFYGGEVDVFERGTAFVI
jgi:hypothetical protein